MLSLQQGTREQIETILDAYGHPRFASRDEDWWLQTLLSELVRDRLTTQGDKATRATPAIAVVAMTKRKRAG